MYRQNNNLLESLLALPLSVLEKKPDCFTMELIKQSILGHLSLLLHGLGGYNTATAHRGSCSHRLSWRR